MSDQYAKARDVAEAAIREGIRLSPTTQDRELWESMLDRLLMIDSREASNG